MIVAALSLITIMTLIGLSVRANARFHRHDRLPMQWSLTGRVNWTAPRVVALSFIPGTGAAMLIFFTIMSMTIAPRPRQEAMVVPVAVLIGSGFVAVEIVYLLLVERTVRRPTD